MNGVIVPNGNDSRSGHHFGVRAILVEGKSITPNNLGRDIFPVPDDDIDLRDIHEGSIVVFHTQRPSHRGEITIARIDQPDPVRGSIQERL